MATNVTEDVEIFFTDSEEFTKFDSEKAPLVQLAGFRKALEGMSKVSAFGAKKYGQDNWKLCKEPERYASAGLRHLLAALDGERLDADSGMPHLWHAMWNVAALIVLEDEDALP